MKFSLISQVILVSAAELLVAQIDENNTINVKIGDQNLKLALNTERNQLSVVSNFCSRCEVPHPFNQELSSNKDPWLTKEKTQFENEKTRELMVYDLQEQKINDKVQIGEQQIELDLYAIHQSDPKFKSSSDGQIGLAPNSSFMRKFGYPQGFTLNINNDHKQSTITFGTNGAEDISKITQGQIKTIRNDWSDKHQGTPNWWFKTDRKTFMGQQYDDEVSVVLNPYYKYLYLPDFEWVQMADDIQNVYPEVDCNWKENYCRFNQPCDQIQDRKQLPLTVELFDQNNKFKLEYDLAQKMYDGAADGSLTVENGHSPGSAQFCYFPMFKQHDEGQEAWYLGTHFMDKYVLAFNYLPDSNTTQVQFGLKNKSALEDRVITAPDTEPAKVEPYDPERVELNSQLKDLEVEYQLYDQTLRSLTDDLDSLQFQINNKIAKADNYKKMTQDLAAKQRHIESNLTVVLRNVTLMENQVQKQTGENDAIRATLKQDKEKNAQIRKQLSEKNQTYQSNLQRPEREKYIKEHKGQILQELKDELDLLKILHKNKGDANDKLRAWLAKNAPAEPIPELVPPVVVPDEPVVLPGNDTATTNPADSNSDDKNDSQNKTLPAPVPFAYSFDYFKYISQFDVLLNLTLLAVPDNILKQINGLPYGLGDFMYYAFGAMVLPTLKPMEVIYNISREMFLTLIQDKIYMIIQAGSIFVLGLLPVELLMETIVVWSNWFDPTYNKDIWQIWNKTQTLLARVMPGNIQKYFDPRYTTQKAKH